MTQEEKAKAYDEALIRGSRLWECGEITKENYEYIFPELKDSEDEMIRKTLIHIVKGACNKYGIKYQGKEIGEEKLLAYLEKQGEHANFRNKIQIGDKVTRNEDGVLVNLSQLNRVAKKQGNNMGISEAAKQKLEDNLNKALEKETPESLNKFLDGQGEQKPAWSEEDEAMWAEISDLLWEGYKQSGSKFSWDDIRNWLNPKLKSLRPQSHWKPSDEQMEALSIAMQGVNDPLFSLYKDLLKLREE